MGAESDVCAFGLAFYARDMEMYPDKDFHLARLWFEIFIEE